MRRGERVHAGDALDGEVENVVGSRGGSVVLQTGGAVLQMTRDANRDESSVDNPQPGGGFGARPGRWVKAAVRAFASPDSSLQRRSGMFDGRLASTGALSSVSSGCPMRGGSL